MKISVTQARAKMLASVRRLESEAVSLSSSCAGRVLAENVIARLTLPRANCAAMDGWAVRHCDWAERPDGLSTAGTSFAGQSFEGTVQAGTAIRIATGAYLPPEADTVLPLEHAEISDGRIRKAMPLDQGANVRLCGSAYRCGDILLHEGKHLTGWMLSLAASTGVDRIKVRRKPRISIIASGDELVSREPGQGIHESITIAIAARLTAWGATAEIIGPLRDDPELIASAIGACSSDLVVTVGGASVGDRDFAKKALSQLGAEPDVHAVDVKPGRPTFFERLPDGRPVLGLPGTPLAALVSAELFLASIVRAFLGTDPNPKLSRAALDVPVAANGAVEQWIPASVDRFSVSEVFGRDAPWAAVFGTANALLLRNPKAGALPRGSTVDMLWIG